MRALVTGATGFIGSNIVQRLVVDGWNVVAAGMEGEQPLPEGLEKTITGDLGGINWEGLGKFDVLFHQAAITNTLVSDEKEMLRVNYYEAIRLFEWAAQSGCKRIVYASSTAVYGAGKIPFRETDECRPLNAYGRSKLELDEFVKLFADSNRDVVIVGLRYCNVYGKGENHKGKMASMAFQLAQQIEGGNPRVFIDGEQRRDYIYVGDVVEANLLAANAMKSCIVNCAGGKAISFNELIQTLLKVSGLNRQTEFIGNPYAATYQNHTECDMSYAKKMIGFAPKFTIEAGIKAYNDSGALFG
ncbi:MAG TPA: NAD-dependent epimerase/dehydratase family protein [Candidatus Norongarragalinales archaeon]|nr:NAD-dependent epimerase/dehydratase family protein [Candidatus Norongarragalinales archaeon]